MWSPVRSTGTNEATVRKGDRFLGGGVLLYVRLLCRRLSRSINSLPGAGVLDMGGLGPLATAVKDFRGESKAIRI